MGKERANPGTWFAVGCEEDASPQMSMLQGETDDMGDLYVYRAKGWCKLYCQSGELANWWPAVWKATRAPGDWQTLRDLWRKCCVVVGPSDKLWNWERLNGWVIRRAIKAAEHMAKERAREARQLENRRRAGIRSGEARRAKQESLKFPAPANATPATASRDASATTSKNAKRR